MDDLIKCESFGVSSYVSAPTSPGNASLSSGFYFYSVPTSPTGGKREVLFDLGSDSEDLRTKTRLSSSGSDGFEFRTNQQFDTPLPNQLQQEQKKKEEKGGEDPSAMMAFADELFCDGKVLPLKLPPDHPSDDLVHDSQIPPLKLPPRLQKVEKGKFSNRSSSTYSSPRSSPNSLLRWPLLCWNLRNEDFDPFMAALDYVTKEEREREVVTFTQEGNKPLSCSNGATGFQYQNKATSSQQPMKHQVLIPEEPIEIVRLVSADLVGHSQSSNESLGQFGGSHHKGSAKHRIKNFLFRSSFEGWVGKKEKLIDHTTVLRKSHYLRRFSFRSSKKGVYKEL